MLKDKIKQLGEITLHTTDFREAWSYFLDHLAENEALHQLEVLADHPNIRVLLAEALTHIFNKKVGLLRDLIAIDISGHDFMHGTGTVSGKIFLFYFFKKLEVGMVSLHTGENLVLFARFTSNGIDDSGSAGHNVRDINLN